MNVERVNALIYAVVMESRGIYMSSEIPTVKVYGDGLLVFNDRIGKVVKEWRRAVRGDDAELFEAFSKRIQQFQDFRRELVRRAIEINPAAGREWGDNDANRTVRKALNEDLEALGKLYAQRSERIYSRIDQGIDRTAWLVESDRGDRRSFGDPRHGHHVEGSGSATCADHPYHGIGRRG